MKINYEKLSLMSIAQKRNLLIKLAKKLKVKNVSLIIKKINKLTDDEINKSIERVFNNYV